MAFVVDAAEQWAVDAPGSSTRRWRTRRIRRASLSKEKRRWRHCFLWWPCSEAFSALGPQLKRIADWSILAE